jgi:anthrone oxygenase-like protein
MLSRPLAVLTAVLVGLLAGAMVLIEVVLVPFWRGLPPAEFGAWFAGHSDRIRSLMVPLGAGAGAAATASAVAHRAEGSDGGTAFAAAGATEAVVAITLAVNEPAQQRFVAGNLTDAETEALLARWARWHDRRVVLGLSAAVAAALALVAPDG